MNGRIGLLGGLLAAQAAIIAGLLLASGLGSGAGASQLLSFDPAKATKLRVSGDEGAVQLIRDGEDWRLAQGSEQDGLPADGGKISELLADLSDLEAPWPVATSDDSAQRFEVTEDNHQRRLVIEDEDGPVADLLLGTSPGYRRVHARISGQSDVYSIDFSNFEAPTDADQWLDKALLAKAKTLTASYTPLGGQRVQSGGADLQSVAVRYREDADLESEGDEGASRSLGRHVWIESATISPDGEWGLKSREQVQQLPLSCVATGAVYVDGAVA